METVQLQCGNCRKVMGISAKDLGKQVQCPHCRSVVQTSPASPPPPPAATKPPIPSLDLENDADSIFSPPMTEDAIGGPNYPPSSSKKKADEPALPAAPKMNSSLPAPEAATDFTSFKRRPIYDKSMLPLLAMIFLIPYAITTTLFIVYLLVFTNRTHPLDMLPDPVPTTKKGAPQPAGRQIVHDHPLAEHQKTPLGTPIQIGDIVVIPEKVVLTAMGDGDLQLFLRVKNVSKATKFEPINDAYVIYTPSKESEGKVGKPYTFLESKTKTVANVYGAYLEYRDAQGKAERANHVIGPGEEEMVILTTMDRYRQHVASIAKSNDGYVWRVQVRRGLVNHHGKEISATAVIGVDFTAAQIEKHLKKT